MNTNFLNKSITIEKEYTTTNDRGTPIETYNFLKESYAGITWKSGNTEFGENGALPFNNTEFLLRYDERINYKCRFVYENQYYKIKHIQVIGRKDWMKVLAVVFEED